MSDIDATALEDLAARIAALEEENKQLRVVAGGGIAARPDGAVWRAWVSAICIVVAALLVPVSIVSAWARVQLVDEDSFVATMAPLAADPAVQAMIVDQTMDAITAKADFTQITSSAIDGVASLGLPPAAVSALTLLKQPAAAGLESLVDRAVTRVVASDAFAEVWATATRGAHRGLTTAATSDGGGIVVRTADGVGIQLGAIVDRVKQNLTAQGVGIAALIPSVDRVVIIGTGETLTLVRTGYAVSTAVGYWLPLVSLALFVIGIAVARRRSTALVGSGLGLFFGAGSLAAGIAIGAGFMATVAAQSGLSPSTLNVFYAQVSMEMARTATVIAVIGAVLTALAWVQSPSRAAVAVRTATGSVNAGLRRALAVRGVDTGGFGAWMYARRTVVRILVATLAIVWLLLLRPLTVGEIFLVLIVALIAWWLTELLQRRPGEVVEIVGVVEVTDPAEVVAAATSASAG